MMKTFSLPFGKGTQTVSLDEAHVLYDLHGNPVDAVADEQEAIRQALRTLSAAHRSKTSSRPAIR